MKDKNTAVEGANSHDPDYIEAIVEEAYNALYNAKATRSENLMHMKRYVLQISGLDADINEDVLAEITEWL